MIEIFDLVDDKVLESKVIQAKTTYRFALDNLFPLINRFQGQRKIQNPKFYERLKRDILRGCIMPPLTIAFVSDARQIINQNDAGAFINGQIDKGYILDGIQRLSTLNKANQEYPNDFPNDQSLFLSIIIANNKDKLLYRMITLNNGQRPMTPRHQIEILTQELFKLDPGNFEIQTEKQRGEQPVRGSFNLSDISKAYLAFITKHLHNENDKIISEKMDELLVDRILDANITNSSLEFSQVLDLVDRLSDDTLCKVWLKQQNNLIGFTVGMHESFEYIKTLSNDEVKILIENFDRAFSTINISKVNIGKIRRELSCFYFSNLRVFENLSPMELLSKFSDKIIT